MPPPEVSSWTFDAIGTQWRIDVEQPLADSTQALVSDRIEQFDATWSRFRADSLVTDVAITGGTWRLPPESAPLLALYDVLYDITDHAVTPLIGRTLADLGYDADYGLIEGEAAPVPAWSDVTWSYPELTVDHPVLIDVGAAGKGCLVDIVAAILDDNGHDAHTIDASGDLRQGGPATLRVGLEHPGDPTMAIGIIDVAPGQSLCASATNRRTWGDGLHHVIDGRTGRPTSDVVATWVLADSCMIADGLATALFFTDSAALMPRFEHESIRMMANGRVEWTPGFPGEVFT